MMHEEICTYEVCKLAKEKGFNEKVYHYYQIVNKLYCECQDKIEPCIFSFKLETDDCLTRYNKVSEDVISAPTQSLLQRWLQEEKYLFVNIGMAFNGYYYQVVRTNKFDEYGTQIVKYFNGNKFDTYELALEDALKYALENLV